MVPTAVTLIVRVCIGEYLGPKRHNLLLLTVNFSGELYTPLCFKYQGQGWVEGVHMTPLNIVIIYLFRI